MDWLNIAIISAAAQGLMLCVLILCLQVGNRTANILLATFVGIMAVVMGMQFVILSGIKLPPLVYSINLLSALTGPALYLYVRALVDADFVINRKVAWHLLALTPVALAYLLVVYTQNTVEHMDGRTLIGQLETHYINLAIHGCILVYSLCALQQLQLHRRRLEESFSVLESISLSWLKGLILFIIAIRFTYVLIEFLQLSGVLAREPRSLLTLFLNLGIIYLIGIGGLRQPIIFTKNLRSVLKMSEASSGSETPNGQPEIVQPTRGVRGENLLEKYQRSALSEPIIAEQWHRLEALMQDKKPFLLDDLTLPQLANRLQLKPHDLSQAINAQSGQSFYELINRYRIEAAQELLQDSANDRRKMLDIAMASGYKSQSTFYSQFKKRVGMTPKQFRDQRQ